MALDVPWRFRSPEITVAAGSAVSYPVDIDIIGGPHLSQLPSVVVSVEGSTTVTASGQGDPLNHQRITVTVRNLNAGGNPQRVRFVADVTDKYHQG